MSGTKSLVKLLSEIPRDPWIWAQLPAAPGGRKPHAGRSGGLFSDIGRQLNFDVDINDDGFGQGFASFVGAWFSRDSSEFKLAPLANDHQHRAGVSLLAWRFGPYFVLSETSRSWSVDSSAGEMPDASTIDCFRTAAVGDLSLEVAEALALHGLVRLTKSNLSLPLPERYASLPSNLKATNEPPSLFDALFNWND